MKRLLRSYVYNGFVWELNCSTSGELNDDKSSGWNHKRLKEPLVCEFRLLWRVIVVVAFATTVGFRIRWWLLSIRIVQQKLPRSVCSPDNPIDSNRFTTTAL
jgi:hypothetical protein